tara:strand:+ start:98 stop:463 length:366 start_codon:yes stop_codon:yes gene_type:complete
MANPSTVPASSAGTEILRRSYKNTLTNTEVKLIDGSANYTYTLLSVVMCNESGADENVHMWIDIEAGGTDVYLLYNQPVLQGETFIWNDKILLSETDELMIQLTNAGNVDIYCTYIEQRWA